MYFLQQQKKVIQEEGGIKYVHKPYTENFGGFSKCWQSWQRGEGGLGEMLTMADKGGGGGLEKCWR